MRVRQAVTGIRYGHDGVTVALRQGKTVQADRVVVTVPIGVLTAAAIEFEPTRPEAKPEAVEALGAGLLDKLRLAFARPFLDKDADVSEWHRSRPPTRPFRRRAVCRQCGESLHRMHRRPAARADCEKPRGLAVWVWTVPAVVPRFPLRITAAYPTRRGDRRGPGRDRRLVPGRRVWGSGIRHGGHRGGVPRSPRRLRSGRADGQPELRQNG
ncbi:FAD-dependent oxidoreductase [Streptomyces sp. NPDC059017]|uniref:FAD-dependent oxidoreductase n=1 Tax=Streptomyces sp. NPDC059017 TaxID=3346700 RepID=UPI0036A08E57